MSPVDLSPTVEDLRDSADTLCCAIRGTKMLIARGDDVATEDGDGVSPLRQVEWAADSVLDELDHFEGMGGDLNAASFAEASGAPPRSGALPPPRHRPHRSRFRTRAKPLPLFVHWGSVVAV